MPITGRHGDTHVRPAALFDVTDPSAALPEDAFEVQFRSPVSLSVMLDGMAQASLDDELNQWGNAYNDLVQRLLTRVQADCGYAIDPPDTATPARLELAAIAETAVPGFEQARWHCHVYIGATATILSSGERRPLAREIMPRKVSGLTFPFYMRELEGLAEQTLGVEWGQPRPGAEREIVDPPWHEYIGTDDRGVCPGPWGPLGELLLADEQDLRHRAEAEEQIRRDRAAGYTPESDWRAARASEERRLAGAPPISYWEQ